MECYPQQGENVNVVFNVHWRATAEEQGIKESVYGVCSVKLDPDGTYTPYEKLTETLVLSWIWGSGVNKEKIEKLLERQVVDKLNPPILTPLLPWKL